MIVRLELVLLIEEEQGEPMSDLSDLSTPLTARAYIRIKVRPFTTVTIP